MGTHKLLPCPFCGGKADPAGWWTATDGRSGPACKDCGATAESAEAWNRRSDRAGLIAGLREAAERCAAISANPTWSVEMISVYECALADAEASIRARITALEEEK